jgi:hypothetical protein
MLSTLSCPWDGYKPATVAFCEARLCAWVAEPANAWSNVGFVLMGVVLLASTLRKPHLAALRLVAFTSVAVGVGSFLFHASGIFALEALDLGTMYLISAMAIVLDLRRLTPLSLSQMVVLYVAIVTASMLLLVPFPPIGIAVFIVHLTVWGVMQILLRIHRPKADYRYSNWLIGVFFLSVFIWLLDYSHLVCNPDNHLINGHAIWHVLDAVCLGLYFRYQLQFFPRAATQVDTRTGDPMLPAT